MRVLHNKVMVDKKRQIRYFIKQTNNIYLPKGKRQQSKHIIERSWYLEFKQPRIVGVGVYATK